MWNICILWHSTSKVKMNAQQTRLHWGSSCDSGVKMLEFHRANPRLVPALTWIIGSIRNGVWPKLFLCIRQIPFYMYTYACLSTSKREWMMLKGPPSLKLDCTHLRCRPMLVGPVLCHTNMSIKSLQVKTDFWHYMTNDPITFCLFFFFWLQNTYTYAKGQCHPSLIILQTHTYTLVCTHRYVSEWMNEWTNEWVSK